MGLPKTVVFVRAGSRFLQLYFTGVEKKPYFLELGKSISHPSFHLSDPLSHLLPLLTPNKSHWSAEAQTAPRNVEVFCFAVEGRAIFVVSEVSLSWAIFEGSKEPPRPERFGIRLFAKSIEEGEGFWLVR